MKTKIIVLLTLFWSVTSFAQKDSTVARLLTIDTVVIKGFKENKIISTLKQVRKIFEKKFSANSGQKYSLIADLQVNSQKYHFVDNKVTFQYQNEKLLPTLNIPSIKEFDDYDNWEIGRGDFIDGHIMYSPNLSKKQFMNDFKDYIYKMREINDIYQITYYSKTNKRKGVILIDKKTLFPKAYFQTLYAEQSSGRSSVIVGKNKNEYSKYITYTLKPSDTDIVTYENIDNQIFIKNIEYKQNFENWNIKRIDKDKKEVLNSTFERITSNFNLFKND